MPATPTPRKLIFHIGHAKTGTSAIQALLALGGIKLDGKRILYSARMDHLRLAKDFRVFARTGVAPGPAGPELSLAETSARLACRDYDYAVISAEAFSNDAPAPTARVMAQFLLPHVEDHSVVCYVRPHAARVLSGFAEFTKLGHFAGMLDAFNAMRAEGGQFFFAPKLADWQQEFGAHFVARPMVRDVLKNRSVVDDFVATAFGPGTVAQIAAGTMQNESLPLEDLVVLRHLQARLAPRSLAMGHRIGWLFANIAGGLGRTGPGTRLALDKATAGAIRATYLDDARALDRGLFAETPVMVRELERAADTGLDAPQSLQMSDHFPAETIRVVEALADMIGRMLDAPGGAPWEDYLLEHLVTELHGGPAPEPRAELARAVAAAG